MSDTHEASGSGKEVATLAGGCFWCLEAVYNQLKGVESVASGYIGGNTSNPSYESVCMGRTGHAEAVRLTFDPSVVSYREILEIFFAIHDPTTLNRQGPDVGTQYRSVIFFHSPDQQQTAEDYRQQLNASGDFRRPIVTEIAPYSAFYPAEKYHQDFFELNPRQGYCRLVIAPKIRKFSRQFKKKLKPVNK